MAIEDILRKQITIDRNKYNFNGDIRIKINDFYKYDKQLRERIIEIANRISQELTSKLEEKSMYNSGFGNRRKIIQTNLDTGVTYVSKELSFFSGEDTALEMRIGEDGTGNFRVKQKGTWSTLAYRSKFR